MSDPRHTYRYPENRYWLAKARAAEEGTTVTEIITARLDDYVDTWEPGPVTVGRGEGQVLPLRTRTDTVTVTTTEPGCTAMDGHCDCTGFIAQDKAPLRCKECGHVFGVHA